MASSQSLRRMSLRMFTIGALLCAVSARAQGSPFVDENPPEIAPPANEDERRLENRPPGAIVLTPAGQGGSDAPEPPASPPNATAPSEREFLIEPTAPPPRIPVEAASCHPPNICPGQRIEPPPLPLRWSGSLRLLGGSDGGDPNFGVELGLRFRPKEWFALQAHIGYLATLSARRASRTTFPVFVDAVFFFGPESFKGFVHIGPHMTLLVEDEDSVTADARHFAQLGGQIGAGVEWRISRRLAVAIEAQFFVRQAFGPGFLHYDAEAATFTNRSTGFFLSAGFVSYFSNEAEPTTSAP